MSTVKPFRLKICIQNNRLIKLREDLGMTQAECSRHIGIQSTRLSAMENLRDTAWNRGRQEWNRIALLIAAFHGVSPEAIWPDEIREVRARALTLEATARELVSLPSAELDRRELKKTLDEAGKLLSPREKRLIGKLANDMTLAEAGKEDEISRARTGQIVMRARMKMLDPEHAERYTTGVKASPPPEIVRAAIELRDDFL